MALCIHPPTKDSQPNPIYCGGRGTLVHRMPDNMSRMKIVRRTSINEDFEVCPDTPIPEVPEGGIRIKVCFAGACYTDRQIANCGKRRLKTQGVRDTSLFSGFEVSGIIDKISESVPNNNFQVGDKVVVYPDKRECMMDNGYEEYVTVRNTENVFKLPKGLALDIASLLPCGGLKAYSAVVRSKPFVIEKVNSKNGVTNVLIVGAGGLGLWTLKLADKLVNVDPERVKVVVADTSIEKLMVAEDYGCYGTVHWHDELHEEYILERTRDVCDGGVDIVIDFVSSPRTIKRALKVLNDEGVLLVGGNSKYEFTFNLATLAIKEQSILGVNTGTRRQLEELINLMASGEVKPPCYSVFPVDEANLVFSRLSTCKITGRAILQVCPENSDMS